LSNVTVSAEAQGKPKVYSPNQVGIASFVGGPFAMIFVLWNNFIVLGNRSGAMQTLVWGFLFIVALLAILPFLPEKFPNYAIPVAYTVVARIVAEKFQLSKQAILKSEQYAFQSAWNVAGISIGFLVAFFAVVFVEIMGLAQIDILSLG
jgi:hypothetical protein